MTKHSLDIGGMTLHYEVTGSGPPLVLLHGLSGSSRWWRNNVPFLAQHFRVYGLDWIGFGRSRGQRVFLHEAAAVLAEWMQRLELPPAVVVGHSMGGYIAADLAANYPEHVARLVLVDALAVPMGPGVLRHGVGLVASVRYMPFSFLPVLAVDTLRAGPLTVLLAMREILHADLSSRLAHIQAPVLIIWGEKDVLLPLRVGELLNAYLPQAQLAIIPGAGHNPMWDRPQAFNEVLCAFACEEDF